MSFGFGIGLGLGLSRGIVSTGIVQLAMSGLTSGEARPGNHAGLSVPFPSGVTAWTSQAWGVGSYGDTTYGTGVSPTDYTASDATSLLWAGLGDDGNTYRSAAPIRYAPGTAATIANQSFTVDDDSGSIIIAASGANLAPFSYSATGLPPWATLDSANAEIDYTPTGLGSVGTSSVTISAFDKYGRSVGDSQFDFSAALRPVATAASALPDLTWTVGTPVSVDFASDFTANGNSLSYAISGLPAGVLDDGDGSVSGVPSQAVASTAIVVTATDEYGRAVPSGFSLTVEAASGGQDAYGRELDEVPVPIGSDPELLLEGGTLFEFGDLSVKFRLTDDPTGIPLSTRTAGIALISNLTGNFPDNAAAWGTPGADAYFEGLVAQNGEVEATVTVPGVYGAFWENRQSDHASNPPSPRRWSDPLLSPSAQFIVDTLPGAMTAPSLATADDTITVTFGTDPTTVAPVTSRDVQYRVNGVGSFLVAQGVANDFQLTGLSESTEYEVQTRVQTQVGQGAWSPSATITTQAGAGDTTPPSAASSTVSNQDGDGNLLVTITTLSEDAPNSFFVMTNSATPPSQAQVIAGQDHTGATAFAGGGFSMTQAVPNDTLTGLPDVSGTYHVYVVYGDAVPNYSDVIYLGARVLDFDTPSVTSTTPNDDAADIGVDATLVLNFSESMKRQGTVTLTHVGTGAIETFDLSSNGAWSAVSNADDRVTLTPSSNLPAAATISIQYAGLEDIYGNALPDQTGDTGWNFATGSAAWQITDNGDGTFSITSVPPAPAALVATDNGDGTFNLEYA